MCPRRTAPVPCVAIARTRARFRVELAGARPTFQGVTVDTFKAEIGRALKAYDRHIVCLEKTPEEAKASLLSLMEKAIKAYEHRAPGLRHGLALDRHVTIILSQTDTTRPLCGIYFNLHSPHFAGGAPAAGPANA